MTYAQLPLKRLTAAPITSGVGEAGQPWADGHIRYIRTTDIASLWTFSEESPAYLPAEIGSRALLQPGDLLLSSAGTLGKAILVPPMSEPACYAGFLVRFRPDESLINARFAAYATESQDFVDQIESGKVTSTISNFSAGKYKNVGVPVPPVSTQRRIVDFLDDQVGRIDGAIEQRALQVTLLNEAIATETQALVWGCTGSAQPDASPIPQLKFVPAHWGRLRNKNLLVEARQLSNDGSEELLSVSHITGVTRRADKSVNMFLAETNEGYVKVSPGDLVINTMWAWMGALGVSSLTGIVSPAYGVYRPRDPESFEPDYYDALYRSPAYVSEMTRFSTGVWSSRLRIYPEVFLALPVVAPPPSEQKVIAKRIREVRGSIVPATALLEQSISLLHERKRALITAAVTGQLDLATMSDRAGKVATS